MMRTDGLCSNCGAMMTTGECSFCARPTRIVTVTGHTEYVDPRDAEIARLREYERLHGARSNEIGALRAEVAQLRGWVELMLSWARNPDKATLDHDAVEQACLQALFPKKVGE